MPGGLLQLTITGEQNKFLTGNPKMTYFKYGYCQHTNFAMESISQVFDGTIDFGQKVSTTITRNGDLVSGMMLEITLPELPSLVENSQTFRVNWVNAIGYYLIEYISLEIGGTEIDRHTGEWLYLQHQLELPLTKKKLRDELVHHQEFTVIEDSSKLKCYVPLQFWFSKEIGNAIPLVSLQYHDVKVHVKFRDFEKCVIVEKIVNYTSSSTNCIEPESIEATRLPPPVSIQDAKLYCDYIFLDKQERKWFAQTTHRYLIEQLQYNGVEHIVSSEHKLQLVFNHPCKELIWYSTLANSTQKNDWLNFSKTPNTLNNYGSSPKNDILQTATLFLNGHERLSPRDAAYFRLVNAEQFHSGVPDNYVYSYPFSLFPEKMQPSGVLNFSMIDNAFMTFTNSPDILEHDVHMFAKNYNILIITQGMAGLAFSN